MSVIAFSIFKGGTNKSTSTVHAAYCLAKKGKKVCVIDLDQQASTTRYFNLDPDKSPNLYQVFMGVISPATAIQKTPYGIDVLTSNVMMAAIEEQKWICLRDCYFLPERRNRLRNGKMQV